LARKPKVIVPIVQNKTTVGHYANVTQSPSGHCDGYVLNLWKYGDHVFGLLKEYGGQCADPECGATRDVKFDPKTGNLEFWSSLYGQKYQLTGKIEQDKIIGAMNAHPVVLKQERDDLSESERDEDRNVAAWCSGWSQHPRCSGVKELCSSMGVSEARDRGK
jgi:hypothetical protein